MDDVVELRVHGVAGASATKVVGHPNLVQVAGDHHAGFYRPRQGAGAADGAAEMTVEGYRWGGLTGGAKLVSALSLLLLPFMLCNLAVWLRPAAPDRFSLLAALCRLLGGTLTAGFVLAIAGVSVDLIGWQCASYQPCVAGRPYLSWLSAIPVGPRLAVLALVPLVALQIVWGISAQRARTFAAFGGTQGRPTADSLDAAGFWDDGPPVGWLRRIHFCLGAATLDAVLLTALVHLGGGAVGMPLLGIAIGVLGWCGLLLCRRTALGGLPPARSGRLLRAVTNVLTVLTLGYALTLPAADPKPAQLPGFEGETTGLFGAQAALIVALTVVTVRRLRTRRGPGRPALLGLGTPFVGAAAASVAAAFAATLVYRVADWLDRGILPDPARLDPPGVPPLEPPVSYWWAALAGFVALLTTAAVAIWSMLLSRARRRVMAERDIRNDYPDAQPEAGPRLRELREIIARSHLVDRLGPVLVVFLAITASGLGAVAFDLVGIGPTRLAEKLSGGRGQPELVVAYLTDVGIYVISLLVVGLAILGVQAYRSPDTRRVLAVLWDLGTFWPRTIHPFAPPSYGRRTVPELGKRVSALARKGGVVLCGHSQGSVLAVVTLLQLPPATVSRVALLTHGSPLHRLYARLCPAYLGERTLHEVGERIGWRWRNLWRYTDPISGPIFLGRASRGADGDAQAVDVRLRDPRSLTVDPDDTVPPPVEGHWAYHTQEEYRRAVRDLAARLPIRTDDEAR
jgi:hypothetical protein